VRIGVDIIEIRRVRAAYNRFRERFLSRLFTEGEITYAFSNRDPIPHLAARFAAKEAIFKATGINIPYRSIEILGRPPEVRIDGKVQEQILISIAHDQHSAIAFVLWEDIRR